MSVGCGRYRWLWPPLPTFLVQFDFRWRFWTTCALRFFSGRFRFQMNGVRNNKMVPGVHVCFSSGGRPLFTPLMNWSQPTIKSSSLCSRCQNVCRAPSKGVILVLQSELAIPVVSHLTFQSMFTPDRCSLVEQIESCLQQNERVTDNTSVTPIGTVATLGLDMWKMPWMHFQLQGREGAGLNPHLWDGVLFNGVWSPHMWETSHHNSFSTFLPANRCEHWGR